MRLDQVLSIDQHQRLLVEDYIGNGNAVPVVSGVVIPGCTAIVDEPPEIALANLKCDSRRGPDARLRYMPDADYRIRLAVGTLQQDAQAALQGMGAQVLNQAAWNAAHTVGDPTGNGGLGHNSVDDALWGIFKVTGASMNTVAVERLPHADFVGSVKGTDYFITLYEPGVTPAVDVEGVVVGGTVTWTDRHIGSLDMTGMAIPAGALGTYDPATSGLITFGNETVGVDFIDPELCPGDDYAIFGFSYLYSQLTGTHDWGITQPLDKPTRVIIDLYESLTDSPEGRVWSRTRYYDCRQYKIPGRSTDGGNTDPNSMEYEFTVEYSDWRLGEAGRYFDRMFLVSCP